MTRSEQHIADWDAQFEQLSAYADSALDAPSRAALEAHLPDCARCQAALADLRAVKAALAALPEPALPRSFAIPEAEPLPLGAPARAPARRAGRAARVAQWLGGIAATLGLTLLLGSALIHTPTGNMSTASAPGYGAAGASRAPAATPPPTRAAAASQGPQSQAKASAEPDRSATQAHPTPTPAATEGNAPSRDTAGSAAQPPVAPIAGATLLVAGGAVFVAGRGAERRRRRTSA